MNLNNFFQMDSYAVYVWTAYSITLFVFAINLVTAFRQQRQAKKFVTHFLIQQYQQKQPNK